MSILDNTSCNKLECRMCEKVYKRQLSLVKHEKSIQDANIMKPAIYNLPEEAIEETRMKNYSLSYKRKAETTFKACW
jgi:hypothetical protein